MLASAWKQKRQEISKEKLRRGFGRPSKSAANPAARKFRAEVEELKLRQCWTLGTRMSTETCATLQRRWTRWLLSEEKEAFWATKLEVLKLVRSDLVFISEPLHVFVNVRTNPKNDSCCVLPRNVMHSERQSTSHWSARRSFDIGSTPSCSTKERARCLLPAIAVCLWRTSLAETLTAFHSIIPKQVIVHPLCSC